MSNNQWPGGQPHANPPQGNYPPGGYPQGQPSAPHGQPSAPGYPPQGGGNPQQGYPQQGHGPGQGYQQSYGGGGGYDGGGYGGGGYGGGGDHNQPSKPNRTPLYIVLAVLAFALIGVIAWLLLSGDGEETVTSDPESTPASSPASPEPDPSTPEDEPTTPEPDPTTPEPDPTTPEPEPTTPEPDPSTPEGEPTGPVPPGEQPPLPTEVRGATLDGDADSTIGFYTTDEMELYAAMTFGPGLPADTLTAELTDLQEIGIWTCGLGESESPQCVTDQSAHGLVAVIGSKDVPDTADWGDAFLAAWQ